MNKNDRFKPSYKSDDMETQTFLDRVEDLTDLELAILLSLIAQHHCLIEAQDDYLDDVASELALVWAPPQTQTKPVLTPLQIVRDIFKLSYIILDREDLQSVDRFGDAILDDNCEFGDDLSEHDNDADDASVLHSTVTFRTAPSSHTEPSKLDSRRVVNVVIAKEFNYAHEDVQIQVLELIRKRRIYSRTTVHLAPKVFLFLPIVTTSSKHVRLNRHLNDRIFMSHSHSPDDGFPNLEELAYADKSDDDDSADSYSPSPNMRRQTIIASRRIDKKLIEQLRRQGQATTITPEIRRYLQDVVAFLRMERGVDGGVTPYATTLFLTLAKYLAPFQGIDYVTPSLVALAANKIYPHRIIIATPDRERSAQYGTDLASAQDLVQDLDPHKVIQNVLETVECPI
ncbi:uncharacterized protein Z518_03398 [Rhinocladiella mackenziei CBS 650.93]|uniref:magnesium chelatase n=1 Tax=Rhinocladiella mackenziei CBS 650.93 TaxID=1442369 RepID=A0A0D2IZ94_9EURO|nr:uncharacterized protein Z518_03398 [Rhinocladiella mackenziei CBS 650.93]KIX08741.1 hypothetical protein Z518_03398 [Rhinocladiella mackenziei CBS 650.93]